MLEKYKNWLLANGMVHSTIKSYGSRINNLLKKLKVEDLNEDTIIQYISELYQKHSPNTINSYINAIKSFLVFLKKDIPLPKYKKINATLAKNINEEYFEKEVIPVIECIFKNPLKVKAILYFMFYTGVRISEVIYLKREDIDLQEKIARILYRKNKEPLIVFYPKKVKGILESYFATEPEKENAFNITYENLRDKFKKINPYLKEINFHPHLLRHSFAIMFLMKGGILSELQDLLGHKSLNSTAIYSKLKTEQLQQRYNKIIK